MIVLETTPGEIEYVRKLIKSYGWARARDIVATEAAPHSPTGNRDGFWSRILAVIEAEAGHVPQ